MKRPDAELGHDLRELDAPLMKRDATNAVVLEQPRIATRNDGFVYLISVITGPLGSQEIWLRSTSETASRFDASVADAFLLPSLLYAMENGCSLEIDAPLSDLFYLGVVTHIPTILNIQNPELVVPAIKVAQLIENAKSSKGVATGLSGGVDSYAAIYKHFLNSPPLSTKLTHLTQFSHNQRFGPNNGWEKGLQRHRETAAAFGLPLLEIGTNFNSFIRSPHTMCHTLLNCSAVIAIDELISKYFYASTFDFRGVSVQQTSDLAHADPVILPLISTVNVRFCSTGSEIPRTQKTAHLARIPQAATRLSVCPKNPMDLLNCSACYKCMRTMATLDLLGCIEEYGSVFDLKKYRQRRGGYARAILKTTTNPYMMDIRDMPDAVAKLKEWSRLDRAERSEKAALGTDAAAPGGASAD